MLPTGGAPGSSPGEVLGGAAPPPALAGGEEAAGLVQAAASAISSANSDESERCMWNPGEPRAARRWAARASAETNRVLTGTEAGLL